MEWKKKLLVYFLLVLLFDLGAGASEPCTASGRGLHFVPTFPLLAPMSVSSCERDRLIGRTKESSALLRVCEAHV